MNDSSKVFSALNQAGYEFLMSDVDLALTMTRIASRAGEDGDKRKRNIKNACRAYETVRELAARVGLSGEQQQRIREKLGTLKLALEKIGHRV
jgi:hypothetical protein